MIIIVVVVVVVVVVITISTSLINISYTSYDFPFVNFISYQYEHSAAHCSAKNPA